MVDTDEWNKMEGVVFNPEAPDVVSGNVDIDIYAIRRRYQLYRIVGIITGCLYDLDVGGSTCGPGGAYSRGLDLTV